MGNVDAGKSSTKCRGFTEMSLICEFADNFGRISTVSADKGRNCARRDRANRLEAPKVAAFTAFFPLHRRKSSPPACQRNPRLESLSIENWRRVLPNRVRDLWPRTMAARRVFELFSSHGLVAADSGLIAGSLSSSCCALVLDHRKPSCLWCFFDDEPNLRIAENALKRTKLPSAWDTFLCRYREGTQAIGAGDYVILSIAWHPDRRFVSLDCRARWSLTQQVRNRCQQLL
jgi:hypothetical protein